MRIFNYSTHMTSASCVYDDVDFKFKGNPSNNQQGINIFQHNYMLSARDVAMNNYSSLVLSDKVNLEDIFELRSLEKSPGSIINTQIGISLLGVEDDSTKYLYFNNQDESFTIEFNRVTSHQLVTRDAIPFPEQSYFNLELIDERYARICYHFKHARFYFAVNSNEDLVFANGITNGYPDYENLNFNYIDETIFEYVFDDNGTNIYFKKPLSGNRTKFLGISAFDSNRLQLLSAVNPRDFLTTNNFSFIVRSSFTQIDNKLNASWASYVVEDVNKLSVDKTTYLPNLPSNLIVAAQYGDASPLEVPAIPIVLKNQATQLGSLDLASHVNLVDGKPGPINRDYNALFAGNSQEKGDENISVNYTMFSGDYTAKTDAYSVFRTSESLYPYEQLNVNDATLFTDGAYAGNSPFTSDQILAQKNDAQGADGQYLCTWLSAGRGKDSIWVDRYYNNNTMSPLDAAKAVNVTYGTYEDFVDAYLQQKLPYTYDFFDKRSDLVFEPNKEYLYYRIGQKRINSQLNSIRDSLLADTLQWKTNDDFTYPPSYINGMVYDLDGRSYDVFNSYELINKNYGFTISFWLDCDDWSKITGYQILGNLSDSGFALINDPVVTPFITIQSASAINILNSDFRQIATTKMPEDPMGILRFDAIDDFGAVTDASLYKLHADGSLYDKVQGVFNVTAISASSLIDPYTQINIIFDSSGSMNSTLIPLQVMRDTILKDYLISFFNYDENLYNERVQIIQDGSERTLQFLAQEKTLPEIKNVINLVFQDESSPYNASETNGFIAARTPQYDEDIAALNSLFATKTYPIQSVLFRVATDVDVGNQQELFPDFREFAKTIFEGTGLYANENGLAPYSQYMSVELDVKPGNRVTPKYYAQLIANKLIQLGVPLFIQPEGQQVTFPWIDYKMGEDNAYFLLSDNTSVLQFNFITESSSIFSLNEPANSIVYNSGNIIGTIGSKATLFDDSNILYLYNDNQIISYNYSTKEQYTAFKSLSSGSTVKFIRDFDVDKDRNIYILNGDYDVVKFDKERIFQHTTSLNALSSLGAYNFAITNCYEYRDSNLIHSVIVASKDKNNKIHLTKINDAGEVLLTTNTNITYLSSTKYNFTNSEYLQQKYKNRSKQLDFVTKFANIYNNRDVTTVTTSIDVSKLSPGKKHFALRLDANQGNATLLVDGVVASSSNFEAAKYAVQQPLINNSISFGACQFINGVTLAQFLKQQNAYFASNAKLLYPKIYAKALTDNDVKFLALQNINISDLEFHLPCGIRNNLDTIKRIFAFGTPGMKSNNIKIVVKNANIVSEDIKNSLRDYVLQQVSQTLPATINILGVEFVDYE